MANSLAIGNNSQVQPGYGSTDDIAIGPSANVTGGSAYNYSTAIGSSAQVQNSNGLAIGRSANVNSQYGMAIGDAAQAQATYAVSIGTSAYTNGSYSVSIGGSSQAQGAYAISIGKSSYTSAQDAIAIGDGAQAQGTNNIAIGTSLYNGNANTVAIGNSSVTSLNFSGASNTSNALTIGTSNSNGNGAYLTKGGTWTNASDRNLKDNFTKVDGNDVLKKIAELDITKWRYKGTDEYHIGPMAQDFYKEFQLGTDDKHISTIDPSGVSLAAIKALNEKVELQQQEIDMLMKKIEELEKK